MRITLSSWRGIYLGVDFIIFRGSSRTEQSTHSCIYGVSNDSSTASCTKALVVCACRRCCGVLCARLAESLKRWTKKMNLTGTVLIHRPRTRHTGFYPVSPSISNWGHLNPSRLSTKKRASNSRRPASEGLVGWVEIGTRGFRYHLPPAKHWNEAVTWPQPILDAQFPFERRKSQRFILLRCRTNTMKCQEQPHDHPEALSSEETAALLSMSDSFIQEAVHMSRHYVGCSRHPSAIDPTRWKRIAHVRDIAMYKERRARWRLVSKRKLGSRLANKDYAADNAKLLPATLMVGSFTGDLESVMFGLQSSTEDATRLRASYLGDNLIDEKLLAAPLESPSYEHPLRSCTLRWRGLRSGATAAKVASGTIFSSRTMETVYIESTGITELSNGERVGYELLQSVEVPGFGGFAKNGKCQAVISYCYVYRQPSPDVMEVFMLGSTSRDGVLLGGALAKMHSLHRLVRCAERKKLAWLLNSSEPTLANTKAGGCCAECFRSFGRWPHRAERQCSACDERVCTSCTAYRQMRFALPFRRKVTRSKLPFCGRCLQRAEETSPLTVAVFEAMEHGEELGFDTFDSSVPPLSNAKWSSQCYDVDDDLAMTILGD